MFEVKVLNQEVLEEILDMKNVIETVEKVYTLKSEKKADVWPMIFHEFERGVADMDIKSGYLEDENVFGLKLVSWYGENKNKNLPMLIGTTLMFDSNTGAPLAMLSAEHVTGMRTGAAGAIGAKYLARKESENLLMVGTGHQSAFQIAATLIAMDHIKTVRLYDAMSYENAVKAAEKMKSRLEKEFLDKYLNDKKLYEEIKTKFDVEFVAVENIEDAVGKSDVIITATPSRKPMIMKEWVKPGTHFSCIGSDMEGKQEIDENIFAIAKVVVDDFTQAINVGESEIPLAKKIINKEDIICEIGDVILGKKEIRTSKEDITIYDSTGIALQDLLVSKLAYDLAIEKGLGQTVLL